MKNYLLILVVILFSIPLFSQDIRRTKEALSDGGLKFTVVDTDGNPISDAKVLLYDTQRKWRIDSARMGKPVYTDVNGQIEIDSLLPLKYWFNIRKDYATNKFTVTNTETIIDTNSLINITITIRDLTQNEFYLCGLCDNKTWITDSIVIFGISQPYDADSKLVSDGTWYDSNGNHGFWWFNEDESILTYDYDSTSNNGGGSSLDATLIELTDTSFVGGMELFGLPATYYMSAVYDTISFNISAHDTTLYLDSNGEASITADDLIIEADYCFTCTTTLSQSNFTTDDIGNVAVYVTMEDRCENQAVDTITITIMPYSSVNEFSHSNLRIYPNPASDFVIIDNQNNKIISIELFDISGRFVEKYTMNTKKTTIDVTHLQQGIYFVRVFSAKGIAVRKMVVE